METSEWKTLFQKIKAVEYYQPSDLPLPVVQRSIVLPWLTWDVNAVEETVGYPLPSELKELWNLTSGLVLFQDTTYGQWGLVLWSPDQTIVRHKRYKAIRLDQYRHGDLIIGEFLGDSDLVVIRCDPEEQDFGSILVALPLYEREIWYRPAKSSGEFLEKFVQAKGKKYWEL